MIRAHSRRPRLAARLPALLAAAGLVLSACASFGGHYSSIDSKALGGDFAGALDELAGPAAAAYGESDALLFLLDAGMLAHFAGRYEESRQFLAEAEIAIEYLSAKSVSLTAASYVANDTVTDYSGEDYEDIYINVFNSLNYYHLGLLDGAAVEARRIGEKLSFLAARHGTELTQAQAVLLESGADVPYDPDAASRQFSNSALARYLSALFYRAKGLDDDARIDLQQARLAFASQPAAYGFAPPSSLDDEAAVPQGKARLNFVCFTGLGPEKAEEALRAPIGGGSWVKVSLPVLRPRSGQVASVTARLDSGESASLEVIEKMDAVAAETFRQKEAAIYLKTLLRATAKGAASAALGEASQTAYDGASAFILSALSLGTQLYADFTEKADLRISRYFPATAWVGGINIDPGEHSFTVEYRSSAGQVLYSERFENVRADAGRLNLAESVCLR